MNRFCAKRLQQELCTSNCGINSQSRAVKLPHFHIVLYECVQYINIHKKTSIGFMCLTGTDPFLPGRWFSGSFTTWAFTVCVCLQTFVQHGQTDTHCYRAHTLEQTHCTHTSSLVCIVRIAGMFTAHTHNPISRLPLISLCKTLTHKY